MSDKTESLCSAFATEFLVLKILSPAVEKLEEGSLRTNHLPANVAAYAYYTGSLEGLIVNYTVSSIANCRSSLSI